MSIDSALPQAHSQLRRVDDAAYTFQQLEADRRAPVDEAAVCAFIAALARAGRLQDAVGLLPRANALAAAKRALRLCIPAMANHYLQTHVLHAIFAAVFTVIRCC